MDNQNNQNSSNPNPLSGIPTPPPSSPPTWLPPSTPSPAQQNPPPAWPPPVDPSQNLQPPAPQTPSNNPWESSSAITPQPTQDLNPTPTPSIDPTPLPSDNSSTPPTFTPPTDISSISNGSPAASSSPLDNPWGAPTQSPAIDGSQEPPQPTWVPPTSPSAPSTPEASMPTEPNSAPASPAIGGAGGQSEPAPTDLSHLISNNPVESGQNPSNAPETLVVPPTSNGVPEVPTLPTENHKSIPKWLIGVGAGLLIIVMGASAYFILGIGQRQQATTSVPAETSKTTVKAPPPIATPVPQPTAPAATGSANFGELEDSQTQQATSAADLLKQRQQGR